MPAADGMLLLSRLSECTSRSTVKRLPSCFELARKAANSSSVIRFSCDNRDDGDDHNSPKGKNNCNFDHDKPPLTYLGRGCPIG